MDIHRGFLDWHYLCVIFYLFSFLRSTIINDHVSVMVFHLNFCPTLVFSVLADWTIIVIFQSILRSCRNTALKLHNVLLRKNWTCSIAALDPALSFKKLAKYSREKYFDPPKIVFCFVPWVLWTDSNAPGVSHFNRIAKQCVVCVLKCVDRILKVKQQKQQNISNFPQKFWCKCIIQLKYIDRFEHRESL